MKVNFNWTQQKHSQFNKIWKADDFNWIHPPSPTPFSFYQMWSHRRVWYIKENPV